MVHRIRRGVVGVAMIAVSVPIALGCGDSVRDHSTSSSAESSSSQSVQAGGLDPSAKRGKLPDSSVFESMSKDSFAVIDSFLRLATDPATDSRDAVLISAWEEDATGMAEIVKQLRSQGGGYVKALVDPEDVSTGSTNASDITLRFTALIRAEFESGNGIVEAVVVRGDAASPLRIRKMRLRYGEEW